jgi:hypothetical protein
VNWGEVLKDTADFAPLFKEALQNFEEDTTPELPWYLCGD